MTKAEYLKRAEAGEPMAICTFWGARVEPKMVRDSKDPKGPRRQAYMVHTTLLTATEPMVNSEFLADDIKPEDWKMPAKQGDKVVAKLRIGAGEYGKLTLFGVTVEPLTDVAEPATSVPSVASPKK